MTASVPAEPALRLVPHGARPFVVLGGAAIVAGGLVSAFSAPAASEPASWAAAYLVLVVGVAQVVLGLGQARLAHREPSERLRLAQFLGWNLGNAAVIAGTLAQVLWLTDVGGAVLVAALVLFAIGLRRAADRHRVLGHTAHAILALLLVSIPVGLVLAQFRAH